MDKEKSLYFKIIALLSFFLPLVIYIFTLCPVTYTQDTAEFAAGPYVLGVVHPPGYPIYCILGKLFTFIPFGSIAVRVNFMSGFWAALTGLFLFLLIYRLTKKIEVSFASAMLFCFAGTFWSQSVVAEVYTLNAFFLSVCLYVLQLWRETDKNKYLYIFSLIYGLSLCNHHFMLVAGPFLLLFIIWTKWRVLKDLKLVLGCLGLFVVGLLPYLYLPIASKFNPAIDWGNPESLKRFLYHVMRKEYSDVGLGRYGMDVKWKFIKAFLGEFKLQFGLPFIIIGIIGFIRLIFKDIKFLTATLGIFVSNTIVLIVTQQHEFTVTRMLSMYVYYFPAYLVFACYIGYGLSYLWDLLSRFIDKNNTVKIILKAAILLIVLIPVLSNYHVNDRSKNYYSYDFIKSMMNIMDKDAVIFAKGDTTIFTMFYLQNVEKYRPDIKLYDHIGILSDEYLGEDFLFGRRTKVWQEERSRQVFNKIIEENYPVRPVYFNYEFDLGADSEYKLDNYGLIYKVVKKDEKINPETIPVEKIYMRNLDDDAIYKDYDIKKILSGYWVRMAAYYESIRDFEKAKYCCEEIYKYDDAKAVNTAGSFFMKTGQFDKALKYFDKAFLLDPDYYPVYYNKGIMYELKKEREEALKNYLLFCGKYDGEPKFRKYVEKAKEKILKLKQEK
ncbi:MAG: DUF2723 domain-containing protein [Armatimonadota bacterium]